MLGDEITLTLNSPITDEQWDAITDVDFEHTDRIWFKTKNGKKVEFVKRKRGRWIDEPVYKQTMDGRTWDGYTYCSECREMHEYGYRSNFCPNCGADMRTKETDRDYERSVEQLEHDMLYEPTYNQNDGSM